MLSLVLECLIGRAGLILNIGNFADRTTNCWLTFLLRMEKIADKLLCIFLIIFSDYCLCPQIMKIESEMQSQVVSRKVDKLDLHITF